MEPRPHYQPELVEREQSIEEKIVIPPEIAWPFQMNLFISNFTGQDGEKIVELDEEKIRWWADKYGNSFREYCDIHPDVVKQIISGVVSEEDSKEMVSYIKSHPTSNEEIEKLYASLEKYIVH